MNKLLLFIIVTIAISACAPVYVPNMRNSPLFRKAGEFQGSVQFGNGLDAQAAVAVTNHIGIIGNYSYADRTSYTSNDDDYHRHKLLEAGLGYYENEGNWCYEVYAGYGKGEGSSYDNYDFWGTQSARSTGKFERYFIQPGFGYNKKVFHFSIIPRISVVNFTEFTTDATLTQPIHLGNNYKVFVEPAFMGRVNLMDNHMFFCFQAGVSLATTSVYYDYRGFQMSTGIGFRIGGWKKDSATDATK